MGYKKIEPNMTFAEVSLLKSMEHNRSLKRLEKINQVINWSQVEEILMAHYTVGSSREGADAYPPLMLLKGLLLEKWYRIDSDPELENQINARISFKKFMGLSFDQHSPDHSTLYSCQATRSGFDSPLGSLQPVLRPGIYLVA